jgi:hypothetical protein
VLVLMSVEEARARATPTLFANAPPSTEAAPAVRADRGRVRLAQLDQAWLEANPKQFTLNLFEDAVYLGVVERVETVHTAIVLVGRLEGQPRSRFWIARYHGAVSATIWAQGKTCYAIRCAGEGLHRVTEMPATGPRLVKLSCVVDLLPEAEPGWESEAVAKAALNAAKDNSGPPVIDIMILYTPATTAAYGGSAGVVTLLADAVSQVNELFARSQITAELRLIHQQEVQYTESGDMNLQTDYERLRDPNDGYLDEVLALREQHSADLVSLWVTHPNAGASRGEQLTENSGEAVYSVVIAAFAMGSEYSDNDWHFAHELGHNLGCDHSRNYHRGRENRYYDDSLGNYQVCPCPENPADWLVDVMCWNGCGMVPYFSNPDVYYDPENNGPNCPTGIGPPAPEDTRCNCAGTLNVTAGIVASYRTPPLVLSSAQVMNGGQTLQFYIHGPARAVCRIESSSDLASWSLHDDVILSIDGNGTYADNQIVGVPWRFYRVKLAQ